MREIEIVSKTFQQSKLQMQKASMVNSNSFLIKKYGNTSSISVS